ncbi:alpha,alpha-trehalase [Oesophagostomum dentatum]|uniref:Trehalase n=1 Tax=Oesophagostomum dentatum TaxID=61180 RepID=A0A0B1TF10_OESDE|nr:alpha,alpha-trehalase [Oesophagostomum dentatum]
MISLLLYVLLVPGLWRTSFTYHIADKRQLLSTVNPDTVSTIHEPFYVNCSVSLCGGHLAPIYCHGEIVSNAWRFGLQEECPGTRMVFTAKQIIKHFQKLKYPIEKKTFDAFCRENFANVPYLKNISLPDFKARPRFLDLIRRKDHLKLAESIHNLWNRLSREFTDDVLVNTSFYPIVPVKYPFIVPGLYLSELISTAKGMIQNFADVIGRNGFIPNSGSVQLSRRSQPPLFVQMVKDYFNVTKNVESLRRWLPSMDKEMQWWINRRSVIIELPSKRTAFAYVYRTETDCPRPENFLSDYYLGMNNSDPTRTWKAMASACESGWDFTTRWFDHEGKHQFEKVTIRTQTIVPVDLNVYMAMNMKFMADSHALFGNDSMSKWYHEKYDALLADINALFWNEEEGVWFDYDLDLEKPRNAFYPSNVFPLLLNEMRPFAGRVFHYLEKMDVYKYPGGIPSALPAGSTEQWDFPNVWAPTQHFFIQSLMNSQHNGLKQRALEEADKFVTTVFNGLLNPKEGMPVGIWEKYDARSSDGKPGGGGEYVVQEGFGWTNGVVMDLINLLNSQSSSVMTLEMAFLEEPVSAGFVIMAVSILIILAAWYALCGQYGYAWFARHKSAPYEEFSSRRLLEDSDSSE